MLIYRKIRYFIEDNQRRNRMEALLAFINEERQVIFAVLLFLGIFAVYRLFMYEMTKKDREKEKDEE